MYLTILDDDPRKLFKLSILCAYSHRTEHAEVILHNGLKLCAANGATLSPEVVEVQNDSIELMQVDVFFSAALCSIPCFNCFRLLSCRSGRTPQVEQ